MRLVIAGAMPRSAGSLRSAISLEFRCRWWRGAMTSTPTWCSTGDVGSASRLTGPAAWCRWLWSRRRWMLPRALRWRAGRMEIALVHLATLWGSVLRMLDRYGTTDADEADPIVGAIILEFATIDPASYAYRYPVDRNGKLVPVAQNDLHLPTLADVARWWASLSAARESVRACGKAATRGDGGFRHVVASGTRILGLQISSTGRNLPRS